MLLIDIWTISSCSLSLWAWFPRNRHSLLPRSKANFLLWTCHDILIWQHMCVSTSPVTVNSVSFLLSLLSCTVTFGNTCSSFSISGLKGVAFANVHLLFLAMRRFFLLKLFLHSVENMTIFLFFNGSKRGCGLWLVFCWFLLIYFISSLDVGSNESDKSCCIFVRPDRR